MTAVPFLDLGAMHAEVDAEITNGFRSVLERTAFVGGPEVADFESRFAAASQRHHCVGLANGTDAIELALRALGVGRGDEVVIPANTFVATAEAVKRAGAEPVLADIDPGTLLVDPDAMSSAVTSRTAALVPVHLYGQMAPMSAIHGIAARHGLAVVEDAAQAQLAEQQGATVGSGSAAAATSFYPGKNLGAYGDAGAVLTDDPQLADAVRALSSHGGLRKYEHETLGFNSRLDTLQAVVLRAKLTRLADWNHLRRLAAARYEVLLSGMDVTLPVTAPGNLHVWHLYVVQCQPSLRSAVLAHLEKAGVGFGIHYPAPIHRLGAFASCGTKGEFPVAEGASDRMISLPMYPHLTEEAQLRVAETLTRALNLIRE